jgi:hypothetical protein
VANPSQPAPLPQPAIRLPMWKLSACLLAAPKAVLFVALLVAIVIGGDLWDDRLRAEFWAGIVLYSGTISGLAALWVRGPRTVHQWVRPVVAGATIRLALCLAVAAGIARLVHPEPVFFWTVLVVASAGVVATEWMIIRNALRKPLSLAVAQEKARAGSKAA